MKLLPSDATLLQAILFGCGSSSITLNSILNTTLSLGFELPTFIEFDGGIARLAAADFVAFDNNRVTPTTKALQLAEQISRSARAAEDFRQGLVDAFETCHLQPAKPHAQYTTGVLTPAAFDAAFT